MADLFTAQNHLVPKAPKRIELLGDKTRRPEPAQHIIEFPGGAIEVSRTTDGDYWAHIIINQGVIVDDAKGREAARGVVMGSRIFREETGLADIPDDGSLSQIAVLIRPTRSAHPGTETPDA